MSALSALIQRVHDGVSSVEIAYASHPRWPLPPRSFGWSRSALRISVLDSSFNPPTLAHLALARLQAPDDPLDASSDTFGPTLMEIPSQSFPDYDARLLLLSVRNADKELKNGDASYEQRLEMMCLLAQHIQRGAQGVGVEQSRQANIAVAILNEPTFVRKSSVLIDFLHKYISSLTASTSLPSLSTSISVDQGGIPRVQLTFLTGMDTLARLFAPRYYPSEDAMRQALHKFLSDEGDNSCVVCARRTIPGVSADEEREQEHRLLYIVKGFVLPRRVAVVDIPERERNISSTDVRRSIAQGDEIWKEFVIPEIAQYIAEHDLYRS